MTRRQLTLGMMFAAALLTATATGCASAPASRLSADPCSAGVSVAGTAGSAKYPVPPPDVIARGHSGRP